MFCKYCGTQLSDDSLFCEKCGKQLRDNSVNTVHVKLESVSTPVRQAAIRQPMEKGQFLASIKYSPTGAIVNIVMNIVFLCIGIGVLSWAEQLAFYDEMYELKETWIVLSILMIVGGVISFISWIVIISVNNDIICTAYENRLVGRAAVSRFSTEKVNFDFQYSEIDSAFSNNRIVTITSKGRTYCIAAGKAEEANHMVGIIMGKIQTEIEVR